MGSRIIGRLALLLIASYGSGDGRGSGRAPSLTDTRRLDRDAETRQWETAAERGDRTETRQWERGEGERGTMMGLSIWLE